MIQEWLKLGGFSYASDLNDQNSLSLGVSKKVLGKLIDGFWDFFIEKRMDLVIGSEGW